MPKTILGKVALTPRGAWEENEPYYPLDIVEYAGESFIVLQETTGIEPVSDNLIFTIMAAKGQKGDDGNTGNAGTAATIEVGDVTTSKPGSAATVVNSGTTNAAVFDITIPAGEKGDSGMDGKAATFRLGNVVTGVPGAPAGAKNTGDEYHAVIDLTIPTGADGAAATVKVGTVTTITSPTNATVTNVGNENAAILNFTIPRGAKGDQGIKGNDGTSVNILGKFNNVSELPEKASPGDGYLIEGHLYVWNPTQNGFINAGKIQGPAGEKGNTGTAATIEIGNVSTGAPGSDVVVANAGNENEARLDFTIPRGNDGTDGITPKFKIGTITTGIPGTEAAVTNAGNNSDIILDITIPAGRKGDSGNKGETGEKGEKGDIGNKGEKGDTGDKGSTGDKGDRGDKGDKGDQGQAGSPDTADQIMTKLNSQTEINFTKYLVCTAGAGSTSDMRFKSNIRMLDNVLPIVLKAPFFIYNWQNNPESLIGSSAQYWRENLPELGREMMDEDKTQTLYYDRLGGVIALKAIQELAAEVEKLRKKN